MAHLPSMTPFSASSSLKTRVPILSKRKLRNSDYLASLSGYPYFNRGSWIHCSWNRFSGNTSAFWHSQQAFSVFAGNSSFNCFHWHEPPLLWIIYCTRCKCKCKRLDLFWVGVRCILLILFDENQFWHPHCYTWTSVITGEALNPGVYVQTKSGTFASEAGM